MPWFPFGVPQYTSAQTSQGIPVIDKRPRCPKCGERLDDALSVAPWCWTELLDSIER